MPAMAQWRVQDGSDVVELSDEKLRKKLRGGDLTGAELARREGDIEWRPLHSYAVFKEEVPFVGASHASARRRIIFPLLWHVASFVGVGLMAGFPGWMVFWGIGLGFHFIGALRKLVQLGPLAPHFAPERVAAAATEPLQAEIETAFQSLEKVATGRKDIDVAGTKKAALSLAQRRAALLPLCDPATRQRLDAEQDKLIAQEETAEPEMKEILRQQALALQQRLDAMDQADSLAKRLEARLRTVLHQTENLRLQLARTGVDEASSTPPSLAEDVRKIQREIAADAEVEQAARLRPQGQKQPT